MSKLLRVFGYVKNERKCLEEFRRRVNSLSDLDDDSLRSEVDSSAYRLGKARYFTQSYKELFDDSGVRKVMWVDSGFKTKSGDILYVQFTGGIPWIGAIVGTEAEILSCQRELAKDRYIPKSKKSEHSNTQVRKTNKHIANNFNSDTFLNILYDKLLIKEGWGYKELDTYIYTCISRINSLMHRGNDLSKFLVFNKDRSLALFNSGLLDKFGKYITILSKVTEDGTLRTTGLKSGCSKVNLMDCGFSRDSLLIELSKVSFVENSLSELVFPDVSIDYFDLDNRYRLDHCISERRNRFPKEFENASSGYIYSDMVKNIELALLLNKCDSSYIKPFYCIKRDCIEFAIPYHVGCSFSRKPELGIIVGKHKGYWHVMTVLDYDSVVSNIRFFEVYRGSSFV